MGVTVQQGYTASSSTGGMTLLGTITATSGATASLTGLSLSGYKHLHIDVEGVSHNDGSNRALRIELSSTNGAAYGAAVTLMAAVGASVAVTGFIKVCNINSATAAAKHVFAALVASATAAAAATNTAAAIDAIRFSFSAGSFDATGSGIIRVYGVS